MHYSAVKHCFVFILLFCFVFILLFCFVFYCIHLSFHFVIQSFAKPFMKLLMKQHHTYELMIPFQTMHYITLTCADDSTRAINCTSLRPPEGRYLLTAHKEDGGASHQA